MGMWQKLFSDGSSELGTDFQIQRGEASWSKGNLKDIESVQLSSNHIIACLTVPYTSWHQFDRFEVKINEGVPSSKRVYRVIQAEVKPHHVGKYLVQRDRGKQIFWVFVDLLPLPKESIKINPSMIGKWITVVVPERGYPYLILSSKGQIKDGYKHILR